MSEIINWLRGSGMLHTISSLGGHTMDWGESADVISAQNGEGSQPEEALNWSKTGNIISNKQHWMDAISETFDGRSYEPYEWKEFQHPTDPNVSIDALIDKDGDTWFIIWTYKDGSPKERSRLEILDKVGEAFPEND
jgi:hypothetical protein|tara:strand:- start:61 stop:471 length:411 start_codon:yes stop_codon:yes gene_type:complete